MQVVSNCNYNKIYKNKKFYNKKLFNFLLTRLPQKTTYAFSKRDLKFKRVDTNYKALQKAKFLYYNQNYITELIFDIDNISYLSIWDLDWIYKAFFEKFNLPITWSCKTDNGVQFCISLNTFYKLSKKQQKVLKDFKTYIINNWELIDKAGSSRLKGWWRNPLTQQEFRYYENVLTFKDIFEFLNKNNLTPQQQFKSKIRKEQIKQQKEKVGEKARVFIGSGEVGNRNNFVWYNTMLNCNSKNLDTILKVAEELNKKTQEPLDQKEVEKIAKSVLKYNQEDKNYIYQNSKKAKWNIGIMGFNPIAGLDYKEYKKEVRRRQMEAGKRTGNTIGREVLIKANKQKAQETKNKIYNIIEELKQKGEKVTIKKVQKLANVAYATAQKYVKQAKEEGLI